MSGRPLLRRSLQRPPCTPPRRPNRRRRRPLASRPSASPSSLVSAALDSDTPAPPLALSLRTSTSHPALQRKKSAQNLHAATSSSRVRLMLSKLKKRAAALVVRRRRLSLPSSASISSKTAPSVDSALFRPYLPLVAQYERASTSAPLAFTCAPGSPPPSPDSSECSCSSDASHAPPSLTASSFSATSSLSHSSRYSASSRPYSFIPDPALNGAGVYEDADPFAKGAVRVVHRSCEALPSTYSYHSANNYASYAASPRVRRTGRGRRVPIAPLIRARARELDVELRELSGEVEADEFVPTQFAVGKDEEQEEQEIDDSGIFLDENFTFVPARSSTPHPPSPSVVASKLTRAPTARTYPIAARARARVRPGSPFPLSRSLSVFSSASAAPAVPGDYVR
ncbi:hypothetical protein B0H14DRAFT_3499012 [Mycena olivaceomarginata]|nr:hypothetical protein B0H14DRAFT_3499012 [Mycena olivaceomarginata]